MKRRQVFAVGLAVVIGVGAHAAGTPKPGVDWPQFRGIRADGIAEGFPLAAAWDIPSGRGVRWKTPIPGLGLSSPIVWGDLVCLSTSISGQKDAGLKVGLYGDVRPVTDDTEHEWRVYCLDKKSGAVRWQQTVLRAVPKIKRHTKSSHANSTLATDGERLIAFFGSEGLYAYDLTGKQLWKQDLGVLDAGWFSDPTAQWETASSPILHDNVVVIQADVQKGSFLGAFDARDGRELWRTPRADVPTWGTPAVHKVNGQTQLVVNGWRHIGAYDFKTGKEVWRLAGGGDIPVPTPVVAGWFDLHHQRARPAGAGLCHPRDRDRRHHAALQAPPATRASPGACRAMAATCARRWSIAASSTSSSTTACSPCSTRRRANGNTSSVLPRAGQRSRHLRWRRMARCIWPARKATST